MGYGARRVREANAGCVCAAGLVQESINKCDVDLRREMYNSVILSGAPPCSVFMAHTLTGFLSLTQPRLPGSRPHLAIPLQVLPQ